MIMATDILLWLSGALVGGGLIGGICARRMLHLDRMVCYLDWEARMDTAVLQEAFEDQVALHHEIGIAHAAYRAILADPDRYQELRVELMSRGQL